MTSSPLIVYRMYGCSDAAAQDGMNALVAAACVNRLWYDVAVAILWRRPSKNALDRNVVSDPARRSFYASHIRELNLGPVSALWHELAGTYEHDGHSSSDTGPYSGSKNNGAGVGARLRLPQLKALYLAEEWGEAGTSMNQGWDIGRRDQGPLLWLINSDLLALRCFLTLDVIDRLAAVRHECSRHQAEIVRTRNGPDTPGKQMPKAQQHRMQLRSLHLRGYSSASEYPDTETQRRFLAWLMDSTPTTMSLATILLDSVFTNAVAAEAFRHFASREGLEDLTLNHWENDLGGDELLCEIRALVDRHRDEERLLQHRPRPFAQLKRFAITIRAIAIPPLLSLMPFVSQVELLIANSAVDDESDDGHESTSAQFGAVFAQLSQLKWLRTLHVSYGSGQLLPADLLMAKGLTELEVLHLGTGCATDLCDNDVAELLCTLPRLSDLALNCPMPRLTSNVLLALGPASQRLRRLGLPLTWASIAALGNAHPAPWFPRLESLSLQASTMTPRPGLFADRTTSLDAKAEAEQLAAVLHEHAPNLTDFTGYYDGSASAANFLHVFEELQLRQRRRCLHCVESVNRWPARCQLCGATGTGAGY